MARWEFKLPDLGEGVTEGEIVAWLVKAGDVVKEDAPIIEVMTDKATMTITSPKAGTIVSTHGKVGEMVAIHATVATYELAGDASVREAGDGAEFSANASVEAHAPAVTLAPAAEPAAPVPTQPSRPSEVHPPVAAPADTGYKNDNPLATPATRKFARERDVDLTRVPPTGDQGRVTQKDVEDFLAGRGTAPTATSHVAVPAAPQQAAPVTSAAPSREPVRITPPAGDAKTLEDRIPFAGMRRKIATKMAQSKQTAAHFTFVEECDVTALKELRARLKPVAEKSGVKLTFLPFIVKAVVAALKKHPQLNTALDESTNELVYRKYYNIGMAASTDAGLMVPVIKDADRKSLLDVASEIERLGSDAKAGRLKAEDLQGSTFTITSLGAQGGLFATPILNFPEVGILGIHQMKQKPVVKNNQIVIGDVMLLSLSFDHRIVDGHVGAAFAYEIIGYLENPDRLFLEMG